MPLSPNLAPGCTAIASFAVTGDNADPVRLNDTNYAGGTIHTYIPYVSFEPGTPHSEEWVGLLSPTSRGWKRLEFQSGDDYDNGGYWTSAITVEFSSNGSSWTAATGLVISSLDVIGGSVITTPNGYPYSSAANIFKSYRLDFDPPGSPTTYVRVRGNTANAGGFVAVNELLAFEEDVLAITAPSIAGVVAFGAATVSAPGQIVGVSLVVRAAMGAPLVSLPGQNIAPGATAIASFSYPPGEGTQPSLMNNGSYFAAPGGFDYAPFETYQLATPHSQDWVGLQFAGTQHFNKLEWQTGGDWYTDSGFWSSGIVVEFWDGAAWSLTATNLVIQEIDGPNGTPTGNPYPYNATANPWKWYRATFDYPNPARNRVRIRGNVSGQGFVAVSELMAYTATSVADAGIVAPSIVGVVALGAHSVALNIGTASIVGRVALGEPTLNSPNQISVSAGIAGKVALGAPALSYGISVPALPVTTRMGVPTLAQGAVALPGMACRVAFGTPTTAVDLYAPLVGGVVAFGPPSLAESRTVSAPSIAVQGAMGAPNVSLVITPPSIAGVVAFGQVGLSGQQWIISPSIRGSVGFGAHTVAADAPIALPSMVGRVALGAPGVTVQRGISSASIAVPAAFGTPVLDVRRAIAPPGLRVSAALGQPSLTLGIAAPSLAVTVRMGTPTVKHGIACTSIVGVVALGTPVMGHKLSAPSIRGTATCGTPSLSVALQQWIICSSIRGTVNTGSPIVTAGRVLSMPSIACRVTFGQAVLGQTLSVSSIAATCALGVPSLSVLPMQLSALSFVVLARFGSPRVRGGRQLGDAIIAPVGNGPPPIEVEI